MIAKGLVHGVRAMTLLLAVLPVLVLPFLIGGVGWKEALLALMTNLSSLFLALAAGLLASSWAKRWLRALLLAEILGGFFLLLFEVVYSLIAFEAVWRFFPAAQRPDLYQFCAGTFVLCTGINGIWAEALSALPPKAQTIWLEIAASLLCLSLLTSALVARVTAHRVSRKWQEEPPSAQQLWWYKTFCTPQFWVDFFRRVMRGRLERNPIGWLQERTWSARLITWIWFGLVVSLYSMAFGVGVYDEAFRSFQTVLAFGLVLNMAFSASGSFRRERETGILELLLVAPLTVQQIIGGRVRGILSQFGPAIVLLLGLWVYVGLDFGYRRSDPEREWSSQIFFFATTFFTLPIIGLYFSLRYQNFLISTIASLVMGCLMPLGIGTWMFGAIYFFSEKLLRYFPEMWQALAALEQISTWATFKHFYVSSLCEILVARFLGQLLVRNLTNRTFAFQRG
ncbi:MAG: hypothetical protein DME26_07400, partial [Verrucomicrobia bacterium]